jgi:hypothetical protein
MNLNRVNAVESDGRFFVPLMSGFKGLPIVCCEDEAKWGTYRTKDTILDIYDALAAAAHLIALSHPSRLCLSPST